MLEGEEKTPNDTIALIQNILRVHSDKKCKLHSIQRKKCYHFLMELQLPAPLYQPFLSWYSLEDTISPRFGLSSGWRASNFMYFPLGVLQDLVTLCPLIMLYEPSSASKRHRNSRSPQNGPQLQNNTLNKQINILPSVLYPSEIQTPVEQWQVFLQKEKSLVFSNRVHYWLIRKCYATLLPTANPRYGSVTQIISTGSW